MSRRRATAGLLAIAGLAFLVPNAAASGRSAVATHPKLYGWTQLSSGTVSTIDSISVARFGSQLQPVWTRNVGVNQNLGTRIVSLAGKPLSPQITALAGNWGTVNEYPVIFSSGGQRHIAFSGIQDTNSSNKYSQGYEYLLNSTDGRTWSLTSQSLTNSATAYGSYGTDVAVVGGTPLIGYTAGTARGVSYRLGAPRTIPSTPSADSQAHVDSACCTYNTGVGYDGHNHQAWTVWYENSGLRSTDGIDAQRLYPSVAPYVHAPGSTQRNPAGSGYTSIQIDHRIVVASRAGGGLYVGYVEGYPSAGRVALWRLGASSALVRRVGGDVGSIGTAAGPDGRVWLYWWKEGTAAIWVARTNRSATALGTACAIRTPLKSTSVWDMAGNASAGPLSLFIDAGTQPQIYSNVVKPCMAVAVSPHRVSHKRRSHVHVLVTDAGAPVRGAAVRFNHHKKTTNRHGRVTFTVAKGTRVGRYRVVVTRSGYQRAVAHVRVK